MTTWFLGVVRMSKNAETRKPRQANWDLLRVLSMYLVVAVHTVPSLPFFSGTRLGNAAVGLCMVCDPVFFMLSGYFAIRSPRGGLGEYYARKASTVVLPLIVYSAVLYVVLNWSSLSLGGYLSLFLAYLGGYWWFVPALVPYLLLAPFLYRMLEALDDRWVKRLSILCLALFGWGVVSHLLVYAAGLIDRPGLANLVSIVAYCVPTEPLTGYFPTFVMGYLYRRLSGTLSERAKRRAAGAGVGALLLSALLSGLGVPQDDPNQIWVLAAFGLMFAFELVRVPEGAFSRMVVWAAKRSFSIYLLHYALILERLKAGEGWAALTEWLSGLPVLPGVLMGVMVPVGVFALALLAASVLDPLVLANAQKLFDKLVAAWRRPRERRNVA